MRAKIIMSLLTLLLVGALIGGGTMAWFTAGVETDPVVFKAGKVELDVGGPYLLEGPDNMNWNPGDTNVVEWDIYNVGTKDIVFRANMGGTWTFYAPNGNRISDPVAYFDAFESEEDLYKNISFGLTDEATGNYDPADWAVVGDRLYYVGDPLEVGQYVTLSMTVTLDGELTGNEYMDAEYKLSGVVEAVQASNDAPSEIWGEEWDNLQGTPE